MTPRHLDDDWYDDPLPDNLVVGERTWIYSSFAFLHHRSTLPRAVEIGSDSGIYHQTFFETGPRGRVVIGDFCAIAGPILATDGLIEIGDHAFISYGVVIADRAAHVPPDAGSPGTSGASIVIGDNVWVGARATILGGARIGDDAVVGALSTVDFEVPAGAIVAGNPAKVVGRAASEGDGA